MTANQPQSKSPAFYGFAGGGVLALLSLAFILIGLQGNVAASIVSLVLNVLVLIGVGYFAGRARGTPERGARAKAGLSAGVMAGIIALIISLVIFAIQYSDGTFERTMQEQMLQQMQTMPADQKRAMQEQFNQIMSMSGLFAAIGAICGAGLNLLMGLAFGALGGALSPQPKQDTL
jgi:hypothetical protein